MLICFEFDCNVRNIDACASIFLRRWKCKFNIVEFKTTQMEKINKTFYLFRFWNVKNITFDKIKYRWWSILIFSQLLDFSRHVKSFSNITVFFIASNVSFFNDVFIYFSTKFTNIMIQHRSQKNDHKKRSRLNNHELKMYL